MALLRSCLFGRTFQSSVRLNSARNPLVLCRAVTMNVQKATDQIVEDHDLKNIRIGRPQSPHLTIYAPQVTSILSISHRLTGVALSVYLMGLGIGYLALPNDINHYAAMLEGMHFSPALLFATKFLIAFPLSYHWCNGIRHLIWDTGKFLTLKEVYGTGYVMLAASAVLTGLLMAL